MNDMTFRPIDALEAKRRTDCERNLIDNKDAITELNSIYGQIHDAVNSGKYKIRAHIHYQYVIDKLTDNKYTIDVVKIYDEYNWHCYPSERKVAVIDVSWEEVNVKRRYNW